MSPGTLSVALALFCHATKFFQIICKTILAKVTVTSAVIRIWQEKRARRDDVIKKALVKTHENNGLLIIYNVVSFHDLFTVPFHCPSLRHFFPPKPSILSFFPRQSTILTELIS